MQRCVFFLSFFVCRYILHVHTNQLRDQHTPPHSSIATLKHPPIPSQNSTAMQCQLNSTSNQLQSTPQPQQPPPWYKLSFSTHQPSPNSRRNKETPSRTTHYKPQTMFTRPSTAPRKLSLSANSSSTDKMTPPPSPKTYASPEALVDRVLERLSCHHPTLRPPTLSDRSKFLQKASDLQNLPEWMWYGLLHYAVQLDAEEEQEVADFGILDEFLDCDSYAEGNIGANSPARMWDVMFYYMYLYLESGRHRGVGGAGEGALLGAITPPATEDGESGAEEEEEKEEDDDRERIPTQMNRQPSIQSATSTRSTQSDLGPATPEAAPEPSSQKQKPTAHSSRRLDLRDLLIVFLLLVITLLLALQFASPRALEMFQSVPLPTTTTVTLTSISRSCLSPITSFASSRYVRFRTHAGDVYTRTCQVQCKKVVEVLLDNIQYRLGVTELPGTATATARA
ncbi:hypothetical protein FN846DRAFT_953950, partial [Sphaerosporella brunnea]